jgi:hypothetical protein
MPVKSTGLGLIHKKEMMKLVELETLILQIFGNMTQELVREEGGI